MVSKRYLPEPTSNKQSATSDNSSKNISNNTSDKTNGKMGDGISIRQLVAGGMTLCVTNSTIPPPQSKGST